MGEVIGWAVMPTANPRSAPGPLVAIGGAEAKVGRRAVLSAFVDAAGGTGARIVVVPTASSLGPEVSELYTSVFSKLGAVDVVEARPRSRAEADDPALLARLDDATGVFMTGGNQLKLSAVVAGTGFGTAVHKAHQRGAAVGGTSAGASVLSTHMVAFGSGGATPKQRMTQLSAGLGLLPGCVIDQHFTQRNRYGRLLSLVAQSPSLLGIGVDEDTAAVVTEQRWLSVIGRGSVTIVDGSSVISDAHAAKRTAPLMVSGAVVHSLPAGSRFDLDQRALVRTPGRLDPAAAEDLAEATRDLQQVTDEVSG
ncbi:MAG: cyanophycinase [Actinomycetota bacterium]|nr:cyanophycinase [Actinomycetota bacterium]